MGSVLHFFREDICRITLAGNVMNGDFVAENTFTDSIFTEAHMFHSRGSGCFTPIHATLIVIENLSWEGMVGQTNI